MEKPQISVSTTLEDDQASKEDLERVLEVGKLLLSVLTEEEIGQLQKLLSSEDR